jgi:hypothetical protein
MPNQDCEGHNQIKRCLNWGKVQKNCTSFSPLLFLTSLPPLPTLKADVRALMTSEKGYDILRLPALPSPLCLPSEFPISRSHPNPPHLKRHPASLSHSEMLNLDLKHTAQSYMLNWIASEVIPCRLLYEATRPSPRDFRMHINFSGVLFPGEK